MNALALLPSIENHVQSDQRALVNIWLLIWVHIRIRGVSMSQSFSTAPYARVCRLDESPDAVFSGIDAGAHFDEKVGTFGHGIFT